MNSRFKFRVWDIEDCSYICRNDFDAIWFDKDGELHIGMYSDFTQSIEDYTDQVIIEQCTGLKDKNGNLIYEGDLLTDGKDIGTVIWTGTGWGCTAFLFKKKPETLKICGNIHESNKLWIHYELEQKDK